MKKSLFQKAIVKQAFFASWKKFNPAELFFNPILFITEVVAILSLISTLLRVYHGQSFAFEAAISFLLFLTLGFANFAEAIAEGRGKAQAETLKRNKSATEARRVVNGKEERISAIDLKVGDLVVCEAGDLIPSDGEVVEGIATVDESAITGESAPVVRESGGDRSAVTGGTRVISDKILIKITAEQGKSFLDTMIALVEGAKRSKTPSEIALLILLNGLSIIILLAVLTLKLFAGFVASSNQQDVSAVFSVPVLAALLVCLLPTTISALLSAIGISGMDRLIQKNVVALSGRAVEAAGDIDVLMMDKTGTITLGNRQASDFIPQTKLKKEALAELALLASLSDDTAEGKSIVALAKEKFGVVAPSVDKNAMQFVPFSAHTRMSGVDIKNADGSVTSIRKGALDAIEKHLSNIGSSVPEDVRQACTEIGKVGGTPLVVVKGKDAFGTVYLKDIVKGGIKERFGDLRKMGIRTVMVTGDNPLTAAAIAAEAGVDDFIAQATPEMKLIRIKEEQKKGYLVAMTGDGTNDAPALAQADVGVVMNTGTQAAREAGNMLDLDSNPTKLIEIVEIGKQILMTRGSLTTFSLANDVAKYFAILPALFGSLFAIEGGDGYLRSLDLMRLYSPASAVLSSLIFNALIIILLVPLALRGVAYKPVSPNRLLSRNLLLYGVGGVICPFIGIKLIDMILSLFI